jgi:hypothetical protein
MIRRLRDRHRIVIPLLALLVAIAIVIALLGRHPRATVIPPPLRGQAEAP